MRTDICTVHLSFQINFVQQILVLLEGLLPSMRKTGDDDDGGGPGGGGGGGLFYKKNNNRRAEIEEDEDSEDEGFGVKLNKKKAEVIILTASSLGKMYCNTFCLAEILEEHNSCTPRLRICIQGELRINWSFCRFVRIS